MIKWVKYHFLHLNDKKWKITSIILITIVFLMFAYFGGIFDSKIERLLFRDRYLLEYEIETFTLLNILSIFLVLMGTKELYLLDEPHVLLLNKRKYLISKSISYLLFYFLIFFIFYFLYQIVIVLLYGFIKFNYDYLIHLLLNIFLIHSLTLLISGKTKSMLKMILMLIVFFILTKIEELNFYALNNIYLFFPIKTLKKPTEGYLHQVLISIFYYILAIFKHEKSIS